MSWRGMGGLAGRVILALVVFFVLGEVIARVFDVVDRLSPLPRGLFMVTDDPDLPYVLSPGADVMQLGVPVRVNAHGLRGPEVSKTPAPGVHRVLVIGDSVTFGHQLPVGQAFPAQLERMLNEREPGRWEVLNGGVQGYDTVAEAAWLDARGLALEPETVIVGFDLNDYDEAPVLSERGILTNRRSSAPTSWSPADASEFYFLLRWLVETRGQTIGMRAPASPTVALPAGSSPWHPYERRVSGIRKRYYRAEPDARWRRLVDALGRIRALVRRDAVALLVAVIPDGDQVGAAAPDLVPQRRVAGACAALDLECLDLRPDLEAASPVEGSLFLDVTHPNAAGNVVIAASLAARLLDR